MDGRWKSRCLERSEKGFTLVEMIVALALMALLLTWAGVNGLRYHRYAQWRKQEEYARSIYLAVQSELMERAGEGRLSQLEGVFTPEDALDLSGLIGADGQELTEEVVWPSKEGTIYVLEAPMGSLARGRPGLALDDLPERDVGASIEEKESRKLQALYDLLSPYIADKSILLEGSIRIELDPSAGLVYGVFYSSCHPGGFSCGQDGGVLDPAQGSEKGDITDRRTQARQEQMIGYYGVDTLSGTVDGRAEKPAIQRIGLGTGDGADSGAGKGDILLHWQMEAEDMAAWKDLTYEVRIYGRFREDAAIFGDEAEDGSRQETEQEICTILLDPELFSEGRDAGYPGVPSRLASLVPEDGYQVMQAVVRQDGEERWYCFPVMLDEAGCQIFLVLDRQDTFLGEAETVEEDLDSSDRGPASGSDSAYADKMGGDPVGRADSRAGRAQSGGTYGLAGWSADVLPWFSLREQVEGAGWALDQLEGVSCTVAGYGADYVDTRMKESNWQPLDLAEEESGMQEEEDGGSAEEEDREEEDEGDRKERMG